MTIITSLVYTHQCTESCASSKCKCDRENDKVIADCSTSGLQNVPDLPCNTTHLYLNNNPITVIQKDAFPQSLVYLNMSFCTIRTIEKGAFVNLFHLRVLDLSFNRELTRDVLPNVTFEPRIYFHTKSECEWYTMHVG